MTFPARTQSSLFFVLVALITAQVAELIRFSGPLMDWIITESGVIFAAVAALVTYLSPALFTIALGVKRRVSGPMIFIAVVALAIARLTVQFLSGPIRVGVGLATVALSIAVLMIVAAGASRHGAQPVAGGVGMGLLGSAALSMAFGTLDPIWRTGFLGIFASAALVGASVFVATLLRGVAPERHARGLWAVGPVLALGVVIFANPGFTGSQAFVPLWTCALILALMAAAIPRVIARATAALAFDAYLLSVLAVASVAGIFFLTSWPQSPKPIISVAIVLLTVILALSSIGLLTLAISNRAPRTDATSLAPVAAATGALIILPILLFTLDYDIPLGFDNAWLYVVVAAVLAVGALTTKPEAVAQEVLAERVPTHAVVRSVLGTIGVLSIAGFFSTSGALSVPAPSSATNDSIKVLSWNLHYSVSADPALNLEQVVATIKEQNPSVVNLQEVSRGWIMGGGADSLNYIANALGMKFAFVGAADLQFGNAILWKAPVTNIERIALTYGDGPQWRSAVGSTVHIGGYTFRNLTVHLQHRAQDTPTRIAQLDDLFASGTPEGPTLITGDFNAQPGSSEIDYLANLGFASAQDQAGDPGQLTFPSDDPTIRIDWIFGKDLIFRNMEVLPVTHSDHRPQVVTVSIDR